MHVHPRNRCSSSSTVVLTHIQNACSSLSSYVRRLTGLYLPTFRMHVHPGAKLSNYSIGCTYPHSECMFILFGYLNRAGTVVLTHIQNACSSRVVQTSPLTRLYLPTFRMHVHLSVCEMMIVKGCTYPHSECMFILLVFLDFLGKVVLTHIQNACSSSDKYYSV